MEKTAGQYHKESKMNSFDIVKAIIYSSSAWENRPIIEWSEADGNDSQRQVIASGIRKCGSKCANNARLEQKLSTISPQNRSSLPSVHKTEALYRQSTKQELSTISPQNKVGPEVVVIKVCSLY